MRIIIDLQGAQTESRFRGVGRYSYSLTKAILQVATHYDIYIILNAAFKESIISIREDFKDLISQDKIKVFNVPTPLAQHGITNKDSLKVAQYIRKYFIEQLNPDLVLLTSLFEGYVDDAVTSVTRNSRSYKTAVILYDLIPYLNQDKYLVLPTQKEYYYDKIHSLKKADLLLAISDSSKNECTEALDIPSKNIINISAAVDESFIQKQIPTYQKEILFVKYNISRKMLMYAPGGFDARKNFENLILAYSKLSKHLRDTHQLVIVSKIPQEDKQNLQTIAKNAGLKDGELIITGYVSDDELIQFYTLCELFIFTSLHEGFGLPVLEAMSCGAAVIASDATSLPEVVACKEALFNPNSSDDIAKKIKEVLDDKELYATLKQHAKTQSKKFSWQSSAKKAITAMQDLLETKTQPVSNQLKKTLAYFSPLPPQKSGISDYTKELLPYLNKYYDITLIVVDTKCEDTFADIKFKKQDLNYFIQNANTFDRVLYQMGNSPFHTYMLDILEKYSGVVMLHDFFLSGLYEYEELVLQKEDFWKNELFYSHGYMALKDRCTSKTQALAKQKYPVNLSVLQNARGVVFHSIYSQELIEKYYSKEQENISYQVPFIKHTPSKYDKNALRKSLNYNADDFIVCSFGYLDATKLNHNLIKAWQASKLATLSNAKLIFVGQNPSSEYGDQILQATQSNKNIHITGWVDTKTYNDYLKIADIGVQLRTMSRGETSAAIHDCMAHSLATIVNANGSFKHLSKEALLMLNDDFEIKELSDALEKLYDDKDYTKKLAQNALKIIQEKHSPQKCAKFYYDAIESSYQKHFFTDLLQSLVNLKEFTTFETNDAKLIELSQILHKNQHLNYQQKQILVDVSDISRTDLRTGIQRVVRAQLLELIKLQPTGYRVEPIYLSQENGKWLYRYARKFISSLLEINNANLQDNILEYSSGDIYYCADFARDSIIDSIKQGLFDDMILQGIKLHFIVYDILPILHPTFFPEGADKSHKLWLDSIASIATSLICISESVSNEVKTLLPHSKAKLSYNHLGADIQNSIPSSGLADDASQIIKSIKEKTTFLMVGTIEPRKGYLQVLSAFEKLWDQGYDINLAIVAKEGWKDLPDSHRRTIPQIISKLTSLKNEKRLFWLNGISDEYLQKIYTSSHCLIAASEAEGFGLPLIEAAQYKKPIIAKDIPVFREVAGNFAYYFKNTNDEHILSIAIKEWLDLYKNNKHPKSHAMPQLTWQESTKQLLTKLIKG